MSAFAASGPALTSGVVGLEGRVGAPDESVLRSASMRLGGSPLPLLGVARVYVCGITPYDVTHLGHAATFVWADVLASVIRMAGVQPVVCRNVTDVDDVLTRAARTRGRHYDEYALGQEFVFHQHMTQLGVRRPDSEPRARHHVTHVQQLAAALLASGDAYARDDHVWFRGAGALAASGLTRDQALVLSADYGDQPDDPRKDDPFDVAVWRPSGEHDPAWPSPWGWGRPGWHAECAAMAVAVLGHGIDALVGGDDLTFPHHAYQSAMVEAAAGLPLARSVLHVGGVHQDGAKMAKSTGNLTLVGDLLELHAPAAVRLLLLDRRWDEPWEFSVSDLDEAARRLDRLYAAAGRPVSSDQAVAGVTARLLDDLDVPGALDIAETEGGAAARQLLATLSLS
ncbi:MAG TPA: cysteine--tRNA ligase [Nocardioidaceae bacterium]|nr:cysteine--tRNA ligase [Nocardioidaceae bacterium]